MLKGQFSLIAELAVARRWEGATRRVGRPVVISDVVELGKVLQILPAHDTA